MSLWIIIALIAGGVLLFGVVYAISLVLVHCWKSKYDTRKAERERQEQERKSWENARVTPNNPFLRAVTRAARIIMIRGVAGGGKTTTLSLLAHWLSQQRLIQYYDNYRYNYHMRPTLIESYNRRVDNGYLPYVAASFDVSDCNGLIADDVWQYMEQRVRAPEGLIGVIDETASTLGKDKYNQAYKDEALSRRLAKIKDSGEYLRHFWDGYLLLADQDGSDVYAGLRQMGNAQITALQTIVTISPAGKTKLALRSWLLRYLPACYTTTPRQLRLMRVSKSWRTVLLSLILPLYRLSPCNYYGRILTLRQDINQRYTEYRVHLEYNGWHQWLVFGNSDLYQFNSRYKKSEYEQRFNGAGKSKENIDEQTDTSTT